jgi:hypothetical protein
MVTGLCGLALSPPAVGPTVASVAPVGVGAVLVLRQAQDAILRRVFRLAQDMAQDESGRAAPGATTIIQFVIWADRRILWNAESGRCNKQVDCACVCCACRGRSLTQVDIRTGRWEATICFVGDKRATSVSYVDSRTDNFVIHDQLVCFKVQVVMIQLSATSYP